MKKYLSVGVALTACLSAAAMADEAPAGAIESLTGVNINETSFLKDNSITVGGWLSLGITYNAHSPRDHFNGPVTFNDRSSEFQVNQLNVFIERAVNKEGQDWDIGGRVDAMWGTDSLFTQAVGHWDDDMIRGTEDLRFYDIALPQAYAEVFAPIGNGVSAKIGHFYTLLGNEVVQAPNNFFYSHAYAMQYGEPFTHTGALLTYPLDKNLSLSAGAVTGPHNGADNFDRHLSNWNFLGGANYTSDDGKTVVAVAVTTGDDSDRALDNRTIGSIVITRHVREDLHYTFQHDHGLQEFDGGTEAEWYGVNQYLTYDVNEELAAGLRFEWFRDDDGARVLSAIRGAGITGDANFFEVSAGLNWKPQKWLLLRPEIRYDWADGKTDFFDFDENAGTATRNGQFTFGANAVVTF